MLYVIKEFINKGIYVLFDAEYSTGNDEDNNDGRHGHSEGYYNACTEQYKKC